MPTFYEINLKNRQETADAKFLELGGKPEMISKKP